MKQLEDKLDEMVESLRENEEREQKCKDQIALLEKVAFLMFNIYKSVYLWVY